MCSALGNVPKEKRKGELGDVAAKDAWFGFDPDVTNGNKIVVLKEAYEMCAEPIERIATFTTVSIREDKFPFARWRRLQGGEISDIFEDIVDGRRGDSASSGGQRGSASSSSFSSSTNAPKRESSSSSGSKGTSNRGRKRGVREDDEPAAEPGKKMKKTADLRKYMKEWYDRTKLRLSKERLAKGEVDFENKKQGKPAVP